MLPQQYTPFQSVQGIKWKKPPNQNREPSPRGEQYARRNPRGIRNVCFYGAAHVVHYTPTKSTLCKFKFKHNGVRDSPFLDP